MDPNTNSVAELVEETKDSMKGMFGFNRTGIRSSLFVRRNKIVCVSCDLLIKSVIKRMDNIIRDL